MFANAYQNGAYLEVWDSKASPQRNEFERMLFRSGVRKEFDKEAKCYLYNIEGQLGSMRLPASQSHTLCLNQRYLVFQMFIPLGMSWSVELGLTDLGGIRRRMNLTTAPCKHQSKYFSVRCSIENVQRGRWLFFGFDVYSCMDGFKDQVFRSLDHVIVGSTCKLRRIFTMKEFVEWEVPKTYCTTQAIHFQLFTYRFDSTVSNTPKTLNKSQKIRKKETYLPKLDKQIPFYDFKASTSQIKSLVSPQMKSIVSPQIKSVVLSQIQKKKTLIKPAHNVVVNAKLKLSLLQKKEQEIIDKNKIDEFKTIRTKQKKEDLSHLKEVSLFKEDKKMSKIDKLAVSKIFKEDQAYHSFFDKQSQSQYSMKKETIKIEENKWSEQQRQNILSHSKPEAINNFPTTIITLKDNKQIQLQNKKEIELQLIFDEMVGCYYHPQTNTYYEMKS